jgi:hypothetical protein
LLFDKLGYNTVIDRLGSNMAEPEKSTNNQGDLVKVTFELPTEEWKELEGLSERRGASKTVTLRQALKTETFVDEEERRGSIFLVEHKRSLFRKMLGQRPKLSELVFHR